MKLEKYFSVLENFFHNPIEFYDWILQAFSQQSSHRNRRVHFWTSCNKSAKDITNDKSDYGCNSAILWRANCSTTPQ